MENIKQVIVVRKDLNMRKGKIATQVAHASFKVFLDLDHEYMNIYPDRSRSTRYYDGHLVNDLVIVGITDNMYNWLEGIFTKICVCVNSEQELLDIYQKAKDTRLPCSLIQDSGQTEFKGIPTYTCCAIGPDNSEKINNITGNLPLL
jgi:peptidyl-tRNA hydrolase, PTH2 family